MSLTLVTPPTDLPVSLAMVKDHLRLNDGDAADEALVMGLVRAATETVEAYTGRALITRTLRLSLDAAPAGRFEPSFRIGVRLGPLERAIELPMPPLIGVTSIVTYDDADTATTFAASNYLVDTAREPGRVALRNGAMWPAGADRAANAIEITYTAGYGAGMADVPEPIRQAILAHIAQLYEYRGDEMADDASAQKQMPIAARALLGPFRVARVRALN